MLHSFKRSADEYLQGKITIEQPSAEDLKLTVIDGEVSEETQKKLKEKKKSVLDITVDADVTI